MKTKILVGLIIILLLSLITVSYFYFFASSSGSDDKLSEALYICPMHPQIQQPHPGVCPICNMDLVLKGSGETMEGIGESEEVNEQLGEIRLSPSEMVIANVQTIRAEFSDFDFSIFANGVIKARDDAYRQISSPVAGKIMRQFIEYEGQSVTKGQRAFEIYSPELVATQNEYLLAYKNMLAVKNSPYPRVYQNAQSILEATKQRLKLWFVSDQQIEELEISGEVKNTLTYYAEYSGVVTKKYVNEGSWVTEGTTIADVVNLGSVWVIASIYENEISRIRIGQYVSIILSGYPDQPVSGRIDYINPFLNTETRSAEIRITSSNPGSIMKPGMFVKVEIQSDRTSRYIVVPRNAVLRTGKEDIVYIKKGNTVFAPIRVVIGGEREGLYLITKGLNEGDIIVSSAGFLLDSESRIRTGTMNLHQHDNDKDLRIDKDRDAIKDLEHQH